MRFSVTGGPPRMPGSFSFDSIQSRWAGSSEGQVKIIVSYIKAALMLGIKESFNGMLNF